MLKHNETSSEAIKLAIEMHEHDQAQMQQKQSVIAALSEMEVPAEYLERATGEIQRLEAKRKTQFTRRVLTTLCLVAVVLGFGYENVMHHNTASAISQVALEAPQRHADVKTAPLVLEFAPGQNFQWNLQTNPETQATVARQIDATNQGYAHFHVENFGRAQGAYLNGQYWADMAWADGVKDLSQYTVVHFHARGEGLGMVRIRLATDSEEWVCPNVALSKDGKEFTVPLNSFYHNVLINNVWQTVGNGTPVRSPDQVSTIAFQVGEHVNDDISEHGNVDIMDVTFE